MQQREWAHERGVSVRLGPHRLCLVFCEALPFTLLAFLAVATIKVFGADVIVFGPQTYQRTSGKPVATTSTFTVQDPSLAYTLHVSNNGVTNATISVNGKTIL